jgi:hypothetical protein
MTPWFWGGAGLSFLAGGLAAWPAIKARGLDRWLPAYWKTRRRRRSPDWDRPFHLLLCLADHFEPQRGGVSATVAAQRVQRWRSEYPQLFAEFRDDDGLPPRHTFFYPAEEYAPACLEGLAELCREGYGEVEIHLHHDRDTSEGFRHQIMQFKEELVNRHGLLARHRKTGQTGYAFIHGNWALDNSRPDGRWCGVNNELDILRETGCYADMTLPSAPSPTQTRTINSMYYALDDPARPKSHDTGYLVGGTRPDKALLLIQGPLLFDWQRRKWGLMPRIENGCLQANQAPSLARMNLWLRARIQVPSRPDWFFVKLYTHGAEENNTAMLLGPVMRNFHRQLQEFRTQQPYFHFHYVTAREMTNLVLAAEEGWPEDVNSARDFAWKGITSK